MLSETPERYLRGLHQTAKDTKRTSAASRSTVPASAASSSQTTPRPVVQYGTFETSFSDKVLISSVNCWLRTASFFAANHFHFGRSTRKHQWPIVYRTWKPTTGGASKSHLSSSQRSTRTHYNSEKTVVAYGLRNVSPYLVTVMGPRSAWRIGVCSERC